MTLFLIFYEVFEELSIKIRSFSEFGFQENIFVACRILINCITTKFYLVSVVGNLVHSPAKFTNNEPVSHINYRFIFLRISKSFLEIGDPTTKMPVILGKVNVMIKVDLFPSLRFS